MGFPGTLGASYVPYLVADSVIAPPEYAFAYTEKLLYLPRRSTCTVCCAIAYNVKIIILFEFDVIL
jgi:predicted O-linked N-acetylglucosamine transferase (SPINDLY family)